MTVQTPIGVCCKGEKENYINSQRYRGEAVIQDVRQAKYDDSEHRTGDSTAQLPSDGLMEICNEEATKQG